MTRTLAEHGQLRQHGELFLRGMNKRHRPPFLIEPSPRSPGAFGQMTRWRLVDVDGYVVRRFSRWRFAYLALVAMCARAGVDAPIEPVARRYTREAQWALVRSREAKRQAQAARRERGGKRVRHLLAGRGQ